MPKAVLSSKQSVATTLPSAQQPFAHLSEQRKVGRAMELINRIIMCGGVSRRPPRNERREDQERRARRALLVERLAEICECKNEEAEDLVRRHNGGAVVGVKRDVEHLVSRVVT